MKIPVLVGIYGGVTAWSIPADQVARLRDPALRLDVRHVEDDAAFAGAVGEVAVAFTSRFEDAWLERAAALRWIHTPAAGVGNMLSPAMIASPVLVTNSRGLQAATIAEHVIAMTLALLRRVPLAVRRQADRTWAQDEITRAPGARVIAGTTVGVVGLGSIGVAVADRARALGARVLGVRRQVTAPRPPSVDAVFGPDALHRVLEQSTVVVLATPLTRETRGLIGARELEIMRADAILVNVGRGRLIDEPALVDALRAGRIAGAALDVTAREPLPADSPLWDCPGTLITPHVAGFWPGYWDAAVGLFLENLERFRAGAPLANLVDKRAGY